MHMVKKQDDEHSNYKSIDAALDHLSEVGLIGVGSSGEGVVVDTSTDGGKDKSAEPENDTSNPLIGDGDPDIPEPEADCCENPKLTPASGVYRLEDGRAIRAEGSDEFCEQCGAIVEADGTVLR